MVRDRMKRKELCVLKEEGRAMTGVEGKMLVEVAELGELFATLATTEGHAVLVQDRVHLRVCVCVCVCACACVRV